MKSDIALRRGDALVVVDLQNDFLPGGPLAVPEGDEVIPVLNRYIALFDRQLLPIFATRDCHPADHCSFRSQGGPWPAHCIVSSPGAQISPRLKLLPSVSIISKPSVREQETYSGFEGTDFEAQLRKANVSRLFVGGLATDYCVLNTVLGALERNFEVFLLHDAVRAVNPYAEGMEAERKMIRAGAVPISYEEIAPSTAPISALVTDLYELTMLQAYFQDRMEDTAVFEFFVRKLPKNRSWLLSAGLEQVLQFLEELQFTKDELKWLAETGKFEPDFLEYLGTLHFTGDVHAMPEGTLFFAQEPILRITAPLPEAQLVESRLINLLQFQTLIASKAARCVMAAPGKALVDFGLRRAHGAEAASLAARASYIAGFSATSNVLAGRLFNIPLSGTMAHSFIQAHAKETDAFTHFARANPNGLIFVLDTYDTEAAAKKIAELAPRWEADGLTIRGVRLDSGDLAKHAFAVRRILDEGGLCGVHIFASGGTDEYELERLEKARAPINGFGIGSRLDTSADAPYLDCAYKIQEYANRPTRKHSEGKSTWPGRKQVYRIRHSDGILNRDIVSPESEPQKGEPLLQPVMRRGRRLGLAPALEDVRARVKAQIASLPPALRRLEPAPPYQVEIANSLRELAETLDREREAALNPTQA